MKKSESTTFKNIIEANHKIKKAIIPLAGMATRLYPISRVIKKGFMPIIDKDMMKPLILKLVEDLDEAGIEEICLIIGKDDKEQYDSVFKNSLCEEHLKKLDEKSREYESNILRIGKKIKYIIQEEQKGFGHAVYLCKDFAGNDPVLIVLGDTYYTTKNKNYSCVEQVLNYYDECMKNIIAVCEMDDDEIQNVGISTGVWEDEKHTKIAVKQLVEKPTIEYAKENLQMDGKCYGNFGMWAIDHSVFDQIGKNIENNVTSKGEYQFVDAIAQILNKVEIKALKIDGSSHDIGNIKSYKKSLLKSLLDEE